MKDEESKESKRKNIFRGITYGLIPHIGCIVFVLAAIFGVTVLMQLFKPLLMNRNIFYYLILISLGFATFSSFFYLKKSRKLSWRGIKSKRGYLTIMYSLTIGINFLLFFFVFPLLSGIGNVSAEQTSGTYLLSLEVDLPCPGHSPLITNELKTIEGVNGSAYSFPNKFEVYYDNTLTSKKEILELEVFKEFPARVIKESHLERDD